MVYGLAHFEKAVFPGELLFRVDPMRPSHKYTYMINRVLELIVLSRAGARAITVVNLTYWTITLVIQLIGIDNANPTTRLFQKSSSVAGAAASLAATLASRSASLSATLLCAAVNPASIANGT